MTARLTLTDVESAVAALAALGGTADEVAAALIDRGITALPGCASACIIAEWLVAEGGLNPDDEIEVDGLFGSPAWRVWAWRHEFGGGGGVAHLPAHLGELAERFDKGAWPELVATR